MPKPITKQSQTAYKGRKPRQELIIKLEAKRKVLAKKGI